MGISAIRPRREEIPAEFKDQTWSRLGVNVDQDFDPLYVIPSGKAAQVKKLRGLLKDAKDLYLATDEDREGEAISWHLNEVLRPKIPVHRLVFHEITKEAIQKGAGEACATSTRTWFRAGNAANFGPFIWLRSFAAVVAQGSPQAFGRACKAWRCD